MLGVICTLLLLKEILGLSFGDYVWPINFFKYEDDKILILFNVDNTTSIMAIYAKFKAYGYFCLLYANKIGNVNVFLFRVSLTILKWDLE
jgi:hypothetical protein